MEQSHKRVLLTVGRFLVAALVIAVPCVVYIYNSNAALAIAAVLYILLLGVSNERIARFLDIGKRAARVTDFTAGMVLLTVMSYAIRRLAG